MLGECLTADVAQVVFVIVLMSAGIITFGAYTVAPSVVLIINCNCVTAFPILLVLCFVLFPNL